MRAAEEHDPIGAIERLLAFFFAGLAPAAALGADKVNIQGWSEALYNPHLLGPLREVFHSLRSLLAGLVQHGQAAGHINPALSAAAIAELLFSPYLGLYLQKAIAPEIDVAAYQQVTVALLHGQIGTSAAVRPLHGKTEEASNDRSDDAA